MNLQELSELVHVVSYLKNVINSAGFSKFSNDVIAALKKKMLEFDETFISEILKYDSRSSAKIIQNSINEARAKMNTDQKYQYHTSNLNKELKTLRDMPVVERTEADKIVNDKIAVAKLQDSTIKKEESTVCQNAQNDVKLQSVEEVQPETTKEGVKQLSTSKTIIDTSSNKPYFEDQSLAALLVAEKRKVAGKKRKL